MEEITLDRNSKNLSPELIADLLKDKDPLVRLKAVKYFMEQDWQSDIVPIDEILECLKDEDERVREEVIDHISSFENHLNDTSVHKIVDMLQDKRPHVRDAALRALTELWVELDPVSIQAVIDLAKDSDRKVQLSALKALPRLVTLDELKKDLLYELFGMMEDNELGEAVLDVLDWFGPSLDDEAVYRLANMLNDEDIIRSHNIAEFLSSMGHDDLVSLYLANNGSS